LELSTAVTTNDPARVRCLKPLLDATDRDAAQDWAGAIVALRAALGGGREVDDRDVWANLANMALHLGDDTTHRSLFTAGTTRTQLTEPPTKPVRFTLDTFSDLDAEPLVDRATRELRASGETARKRDPSTIVQLTPTEQRIAELVSPGLSNMENDLAGLSTTREHRVIDGVTHASLLMDHDHAAATTLAIREVVASARSH
jgi:hypothetical protein